MNGIHLVTLPAGGFVIDINFGNVAFELVSVDGGLTWGYWKTHTGTDATPPEAPQDAVYLTLSGNAINLGTDGQLRLIVDSPEDADLVFAADGTADEPSQPLPGEIGDLCSVGGSCRPGDWLPPADCSGDCHELATAQLLAVELNVQAGQFPANAIYMNTGCGGAFSGQTVSQIIAAADAALTTWFSGSFDFGTLLCVLDAINNNNSSGVLFTFAGVIGPPPPSPLCFVLPAICA